MTLRNLSDVLVVLLRDLFSSELQITEAVVAMEKDASSPQLKKVLRLHRNETQEHIDRLKKSARRLVLN